MASKKAFRELIWVAPASLGLGAILSALDGGVWWIGWLAYSFILLLGLSALAALWRRSCGEQGNSSASRILGLILVLSLLLRLGLGIALTYILPASGYGSPAEQHGYVFYDAFRRDKQAWELARSTNPVWTAFDKSYSTDQYGGMLFLSGLAYRYLSPDTHRPWLVITLAALTAGFGVVLAWRAARQMFGQRGAMLTAWILALYPESILQGGSQMREPFLITFVAMVLWGLVDWQANRQRRAWLWMIGGLIGMLFFSPGIALFATVVLVPWIWLKSERRLSWIVILLAVAVLLVGVIFLWIALTRGEIAGTSPIAVIEKWIREAVRWDVYVTSHTPSGIRKLLKQMPEWTQLPFVVGYGIAQPALPAVWVDSAAWPWRVIGILRALGWYAIAPFLAFSIFAVARITSKHERRAWLWLWLAVLAWVVISAARAGGDQWDNPRYRVIFLILQALLANMAWVNWREKHNPWLARVLAVEGVFLAFFTYWYVARYGGWEHGQVSFLVIVLAITVISLLILVGGWVWDRWHARKSYT